MPILNKIFDILSGAASAIKLNVPLGKDPAPAPPGQPSRAKEALERGGVTPTPMPTAPVNVDLVLEKLGEQTGATDWRHSIVDLMKCFGYDASLDNRLELAHELGYQGSTEDTAEMNMWLHKELMQKIVAQGGKLELKK